MTTGSRKLVLLEGTAAFIEDLVTLFRSHSKDAVSFFRISIKPAVGKEAGLDLVDGYDNFLKGIKPTKLTAKHFEE